MATPTSPKTIGTSPAKASSPLAASAPPNTQPQEDEDSYDPSLPIAVDNDITSDYASSSAASSTQSVTASVLDYVYENGRRYHSMSQGAYTMPNDETEQDRLDLTHHMMLIVLKGELNLAPIDHPHRVLDCGTGTGIWALDFGDQHPEAEVTGVDLSAIQPGWTAPNVKFELDDLEKSWTWPEDHFDFIHSRTIMNGIHDWSKYIQQMYRHTKPGGYVEIQEWDQKLYSDDGSADGDSPLCQYWRIYPECARKAGLRLPTGEELTTGLAEAGFVDIKVATYNVPWGSWPKNKRLKHIGATIHAIAETGLEAYGVQLLTKYTDMSGEEVQKLIHDALRDLTSNKVHGYQKMWQIYGRKPLKTE